MANKIIYFSKRCINTSSICYGKRNFRKFPLHGFRGTEEFRKRMKEDPDPDIPVYDYGVRKTTCVLSGKSVEIPEKIPELIVPDITGFELKPYVSYKVPDVTQTEFTAKDLFDAVYSQKIADDYRAGKLDENGDSLEPNEYECLTAEEAKKKARQTGCDMFTQELNEKPPLI